MQGHHHPVKNLINKLVRVIFPQLIVVLMNSLLLGWTPSPIHQRKRHHGAYRIHDIRRHEESEWFPSCLLHSVLGDPIEQIIGDHFCPIEWGTFCYSKDERYPLDVKMCGIIPAEKPTSHHRHIPIVWLQRRNRIHTLVVHSECRGTRHPILYQAWHGFVKLFALLLFEIRQEFFAICVFIGWWELIHRLDMFGPKRPNHGLSVI
jgi:hypothetical protein